MLKCEWKEMTLLWGILLSHNGRVSVTIAPGARRPMPIGADGIFRLAVVSGRKPV